MTGPASPPPPPAQNSLEDDPAVAAVVACVREVSPSAVITDVDQDLVRARVVESMKFVELMFLLEERSGRSVDLERVGGERLRSVAGLAALFFDGQDVA